MCLFHQAQWHLYDFPVAVIVSYHQSCGLEQQEPILSQVEGPEGKIKVLAGWCSLQGSGGESFLLFQNLGAPCVLRPRAASSPPLPLSSRTHVSNTSLPFAYEDTRGWV